MRRTALVALLATALAGCAGLGQIDYGSLGSRAMWQHPQRVVDTLEIRPGDRVVDLGAGGGYFLPYLSEAVGPSGRVYAVEVDANTILDLTRTVESRGLENVEIVLGDHDDPHLPDARIDLVLLVNTYHHIEARRAYFSALRGDLAAAGRVAVIDPDAELRGALQLLLDSEHTSSRAGLRGEMAAAGYAPAASFEFLPTQIFEVFVPLDGSAQLAGADAD